MVRDAADATETIARSSALLDRELGAAKMKQNVCKAEHVPLFIGPGQDAHTKAFVAAIRANGMGEVRRQARYLGAQVTYNGAVTATVRARIMAAKEAFYGMGRMWRRMQDGVTKRLVFKGLVLGTLLSGLEAEVLRECDYKQMDECIMGLARKTLGSWGKVRRGGQVAKRTNEEVRVYMGVACIRVEMARRRLGWMQDILRYPTQNV